MLTIFITLAAFAILMGLIGGLLSWSYRSRILTLEWELEKLKQTALNQPEVSSPANRVNRATLSPVEPNKSELTPPPSTPPDAESALNRPAPERPKAPSAVQHALNHLKQHWMIWLGGVCIGLAGIFLVRYSIEAGLLGPAARIVLALTTGLALHGIAEWLRRRTGDTHPAFAALAGGSSIILYAAMLAALHLYDLLSPGTTFAVLAIIAVGTMCLSLLHGPVLAIIGLLGAYVVPILVSGGSGSIAIALIYSLIISGAALLLTRYTYRIWLWGGMLCGALCWWLLSLGLAEADQIRGFYLAALAYGILAIPGFNWTLQRIEAKLSPESQPVWQGSQFALRPLLLGLGTLIVAQATSISVGEFSPDALLLWSPLVIVCLFAARAQPCLALLPWFALLCHWLGWFIAGLEMSDGHWKIALQAQEQSHFLQYAVGTAFIFTALCWWLGRGQPFARARTSLMIMAPLCWLALAYVLVTELSIDWQWSLAAAVLGAVYLQQSRKELLLNHSDNAPWLILGGHLAYSLAVAMLFREASLTLALATQLVSLAWLIQRFQLRELDWLIKLVLATVLLRLTFNPWLLSYPTDVHWSLWTYGGSLLSIYCAMLLTPAHAPLRRWLGAASVQMLVLFLAAETRYWLYDGDIFRQQYSLTEASLNSLMWSGLGLAYYLRSGVAQTLESIYKKTAGALLLLACVNQALILTFLNPLWNTATIGTTALFNIISLAFGLPAIMAYLVYRFYLPRHRKLAGGLASLCAFTCVSLHIRHLWQGSVDIYLATSDGELYTYSAVWLIIAAATILYAGWRARPDLYRAGMTLLLVVVAKLFLVDMAGLEGLLRVASFMGLGLSLLALAYLYQRQKARQE